MRQQRPTWPFLRVQDADLLAEHLAHDFDGLEQVGIIRDDHRQIEPTHMRVVQEVRGKVHVRALFLGLDDANVLLPMARNGWKRHRDFVRKEVSQVNRKPGQGAKRPKVKLLPDRLIRVARSGRNQGGEVFDFSDRVSGQQELAERPRVNPFVRSFTKGSIVKVEAVNVNICSYSGLRKCRSRPKAASRPAAEATGGICFNYIPRLPESQTPPRSTAA